MKRFKVPVSALILVFTPDLEVLLLERADFPDHWQSVTGSQEPGETLMQTAMRELREETGIAAEAFGGLADWALANDFEIFPQWRHRYPEGTLHNTEHVFGLQVPTQVPVVIAPREHLQYAWVDWKEAAKRCFSWTNRDAILLLPTRAGVPKGMP
ncbi:MAG: dihydroneopterin triphosphate diphosphatase [Casimicrobiaceae bacterium]